MSDNYLGNQKIKDVLREQFYFYVRRNGKYPKKLVFNSRHYKNILESECSEILFLDVNNKIRRNEFMGMELIFLDDVYGGSFNWGFGE